MSSETNISQNMFVFPFPLPSVYSQFDMSIAIYHSRKGLGLIDAIYSLQEGTTFHSTDGPLSLRTGSNPDIGQGNWDSLLQELTLWPPLVEFWGCVSKIIFSLTVHLCSYSTIFNKLLSQISMIQCPC